MKTGSPAEPGSGDPSRQEQAWSRPAVGRLERAAEARHEAERFEELLRRLRTRRDGGDEDDQGGWKASEPDAAAERLRQARRRLGESLLRAVQAHERLARNYEWRALRAEKQANLPGSVDSAMLEDVAWFRWEAARHWRAAQRMRVTAGVQRPSRA
ncbi:hypothetical protein [Nonomuraea sp. NPDC050643]|uniref:hypothetical protein n=1 Tax=Nonomuraea sp. NPDC050643 TaxID=3155660 RepID=UPI0033F7C549